jgi:hypothetical protein
VCNADGLGSTTTACGAAQTCSGGACADPVCTPGALSCADVNTRRVCNADGLGYTAAACPAMNACLGAGVCTPWVCTPGPTAVCASGTARQVCAADGQGYVGVDCGPAASNAVWSCSTGVCSFVCNAGYGNCDGNVTNGCESNLNTVTSCGGCSPCSSGRNCQNGTCVAACGASNFTHSCGLFSGRNCPAHSTCNATSGCTCVAGYVARTCSGSVCSGCTYPNWWCVPAS